MRTCLALFFMLSLIACANFQLSDSELEWNPYSSGQVLKFESKTGEQLVMKITQVAKSKSKINPYAGNFSGKYEQLFITYTVLEGGSTSGEHALLAIGKSPKGEGFFNPIIEIPAIIHQNEPIDFATLAAKPKTTIMINGKKYTDVVVFNPSRPENDLSFPHLIKVHWSKSIGLLRIELSNQTVWELNP